MPEATLAEEAAEMDLAFKPESDAAYELARMRHSCAHLMAEAVQEIFPDAKFAIGPAIENGFYYDIDLPRPLTPEDLTDDRRANALPSDSGRAVRRDRLSRAMRRCRSSATTPTRSSSSKACRPMRRSRRTSKATSSTSAGDPMYRPQATSARSSCSRSPAPTGAATRSTRCSSASTARPGRRRQSSTATCSGWKRLRRRDHRRLGRELDLFSVSEEIGPGLILWHPKGGLIRFLIEQFEQKEQLARGYDLVYTPHIASEKIYKISGHLETYAREHVRADERSRRWITTSNR